MKTAAAAACFAALLNLASCRQKETQATIKADANALPVKVVEVKAEPFTLTVPVTGNLVSRSVVTVKGETTGRLLYLKKEEGEAVTAGEELGRVNDENQRLAVAQARSAVQAAEAALARARVAAEHSRTELERARNLIKTGGITERDLQAAETADRDARAQIAVAEAQLAQSRAALDIAEKHLRDTIIRAPISGIIEQKFVNPGSYIEPPTQIVTIVDNQALELESPVPAVHLAEVAPGQRVRFRVASFPGTEFEGHVLQIGASVDTLNRAAKVRIKVNNSSGRLKAGMFAEGEIITGLRRDAVLAPVEAVYRSSGSGAEAYVFVVDNGKVFRRQVRLGRETDGRVEVLSGLKPAELLVAEQRIELADGVSVAAGK